MHKRRRLKSVAETQEVTECLATSDQQKRRRLNSVVADTCIKEVTDCLVALDQVLARELSRITLGYLLPREGSIFVKMTTVNLSTFVHWAIYLNSAWRLCGLTHRLEHQLMRCESLEVSPFSPYRFSLRGRKHYEREVTIDLSQFHAYTATKTRDERDQIAPLRREWTVLEGGESEWVWKGIKGKDDIYATETKWL